MKDAKEFLWNMMAVIGVIVTGVTLIFFTLNASSLSVLFQTMTLIETQSLYENEVDSNEFIMGAAQGIVSALDDPYSYYMDPQSWQEQLEAINAEFAGIGVYMSLLEDGTVVFMAPIPGTPAEAAGVQSGDILLEVDGIAVGGLTLDEVSTLVRGEVGSEVTLTIQREGEGVQEMVLTRAIIEVPSVHSEMLDEEAGIGYIYLSTFHSKSDDEIREKTEELEAMGAKSLILDLRDNGGGDYNAALQIADYFLDDKDIVQIADASGILYVEHTNPGANPIPLVVLVGPNTASASEVLASALQDNYRARLVGQQTYGKGIIQVLFPLSDGGALKLTTTQYLNLAGREIHNTGLTPDEIVEESLDYTVDLPLEKAMEMLRNL